MPIHQDEALACLKLVVCVAKADGRLAPEEEHVLRESLETMNLPAGTNAKSLLAGTYDVDALVKEIKSQDARDAAYSACYTMAYADADYDKAEQAILEKMEKAWEVPKEKKNLFGRMFQEAKETVSFTAIKPIADPKKRDAEVNEDVLKYSGLAAVLGLNPVPFVKLATELAVLGVQGKMVRDIGQYWGQETTQAGVKQLLVGMGAGQVGRIAMNTLLGFVPVLGSVIPAVSNFASTWAVGRVANEFYASGGKMDKKTLQAAFKSRQKEGRDAYSQHKATVEAKAARNKALLDDLGGAYKAGKITQAEYERSVLELK
jgi:uncharacterized protein (DUF697 family)/uncharacterized tellurite resistance protein B-like protein